MQKVYDKALKSHVFVCDGGPSAKMQLPKDDRRSLGLVQPYLALQIHVRQPSRPSTRPARSVASVRACVHVLRRRCGAAQVPDSKPFALELSISDTARARRRLLFSTSFREAVRASRPVPCRPSPPPPPAPLPPPPNPPNSPPSPAARRPCLLPPLLPQVCTPLHTRVPLGGLPRGVWVNLVLDMATLTASNFGGARFGRLEGISIGASCRLRKICTLKDASFIGPGGSPTFLGPGECVASDHPAYAATVPKGMERPQGHSAPPPLGSAPARLLRPPPQGRAWRLWAARRSQGEARPLGARHCLGRSS